MNDIQRYAVSEQIVLDYYVVLPMSDNAHHDLKALPDAYDLAILLSFWHGEHDRYDGHYGHNHIKHESDDRSLS